MKSQILIDTNAIKHNLSQFQQISKPANVIPIVKSNSYGHGDQQVFQALQEAHCPMIGVNYTAEGQTWRDLGFEGRILVLGPISKEDLILCSSLDLEAFIANAPILDQWLQMDPRPKGHLKFDTGMARQGFFPEQASKLVEQLAPYKEDIQGLCSHFANVEDVLEHDYAREQIKRFKEALAVFRSQGFDVEAHIASSASGLLLPDSRFDFVRLGISLYGLWPSPATRLSYLQINQSLIDLKPALSWTTEISSIKSIEANQFIGYGCTYRAVQPMTIAVLPVGYFEGFPRLAGAHGAYVLAHGMRCPIVGRVCMNMMMVDISHLQGPQIGDRVTLIGTEQDESISAAALAAWADTIHYEMLSRLNPIIPRFTGGQP